MDAIKPPAESKIDVTTDRNSFTLLTLPAERRGFARFAVSLFLLCWLGGWAFGWVAAFHQILRGTKGPEAFLVFWLIAWSVGGAWAIWCLYRFLRPVVPERLGLAKPNLVYDSGIQPPPIFFGYWRGQKDYWKRMFEKRKQIEFTRKEIPTLRLRDTDDGNRLTLDHANERIDIGKGLTEIEREWLFEVIKAEYKL
ncbi:MAG TPA: hypothetical protein VH170_00480 [Chthoniobacterales bacterium]|jgi:hypothetical protein|nr:hypothetical protein [Chthoniobacterales bacterium]